ncbi:MAG: sensor histidine kinase [Bacteroidales bacterium]
MIFGSIVQYLIFRNSIHLSADDSLDELKKTLVKYTSRNDTFMLAGDLGVKNGRLIYTPVSSINFETFYQDTVIWNRRTLKNRDFRIINFPVLIKQKPYKVSIFMRTMGHADLVTSTVFSFLCYFLLLLLYIFLISHFFTRNMWIPFRQFLHELKTTDINKKSTFTFSDSNIDELKELDKTYARMMKRIHNDYRKTKELSENLTHELQTPLTIMRAKIDLLQQRFQDDEETFNILQSLQNNINRVSYFNKSLMLLTRINNDQYAEYALIDFGTVIKERIDDYIDIIHTKNIHIIFEQYSSFIHEINPTLLELMINNIFSNAVKYNKENEGFLQITISNDKIIFENPYEGILPSGNIFDRFKRSDKKCNDSTGLGLSIVKAICDKSHLVVTVETVHQKFRLILSFRY